MANEYQGFSGSSITISTKEFQEIKQGFKGTSITSSLKQYIEPSYGFKGSVISLLYFGNASKITHFK